ncbi:MAG TPA: hypothetical protein VG759_19605 [Candidatus Angelobacter sp.]|nr:hypothetical protein [Candidatus Angelobacter sp.]
MPEHVASKESLQIVAFAHDNGQHTERYPSLCRFRGGYGNQHVDHQ